MTDSTLPDVKRLLTRTVYRSLRRTAREAQDTWVGAHWPSMDTLRVNGIGVDFGERRPNDARIRRFISTFSPDMLLRILDAVLVGERDESPR